MSRKHALERVVEFGDSTSTYRFRLATGKQSVNESRKRWLGCEDSSE